MTLPDSSGIEPSTAPTYALSKAGVGGRAEACCYDIIIFKGDSLITVNRGINKGGVMPCFSCTCSRKRGFVQAACWGFRGLRVEDLSWDYIRIMENEMETTV